MGGMGYGEERWDLGVSGCLVLALSPLFQECMHTVVFMKMKNLHETFPAGPCGDWPC